MSIPVSYLDREFKVEITSFTPGCPAKLFALPENCYPEEPTEIEWEVSDSVSDCEFIQAMLDSNSNFFDAIDEQVYRYKENEEPDEPEPDEPDIDYDYNY